MSVSLIAEFYPDGGYDALRLSSPMLLFFPFPLYLDAAGCSDRHDPVRAADVTPKMQPKIDTYKKQAAMWAMDPVIVKAVKESNAKGPIPMLGNAKWRELKESDPIVKGLVDNPPGSA